MKTSKKSRRSATDPFVVKVTGAGRPIMLIPGLTCGGNVWDDTVKHLKAHFECHTLTLAGFAGQPSIGVPFLISVRDGLVAYIRDQGLDKPIILGHSLGGFMAFWLAVTIPEEIGPIISVDGLPFLPARWDVDATSDTSEPAAQALRGVVEQLTPVQFGVVSRLVLSTMMLNPLDVERVLRVSEKSDPTAVGQAAYELTTIDLRDELHAIRVPALLLGSTADEPFPARKKKLKANYRAQVATIGQCKVVFAAIARHFIQLDEPAFFFRELESFLGSS